MSPSNPFKTLMKSINSLFKDTPQLGYIHISHDNYEFVKREILDRALHMVKDENSGSLEACVDILLESFEFRTMVKKLFDSKYVIEEIDLSCTSEKLYNRTFAYAFVAFLAHMLGDTMAKDLITKSADALSGNCEHLFVSFLKNGFNFNRYQLQGSVIAEAVSYVSLEYTPVSSMTTVIELLYKLNMTDELARYVTPYVIQRVSQMSVKLH